MSKNKIAVFLFFALSLQGFSAEAGDASFWFTLETGKGQFRKGNYESALAYFEDARAMRRRYFEVQRGFVLTLLSMHEVRSFEDDLETVLYFVDYRKLQDAKDAFDELFFRVSKDELRGRASAALDLFDELKDYPEAEFWIGEVYGMEGSASIALKQYQKALSMAEKRGDSVFAEEISFKIANLERLSGGYNEFERTMQKILVKDSLWNDDSKGFIRSAMQKTLREGGVNAFLNMYRYKNEAALSFEKAHRALAEYYYRSGRHKKAAEHYIFAWTITSTVIIDAYTAAQIEKTPFTSLAAITGSLSRLPAIVSFMDDVDYYKTAFYMASSLYGAGEENAARNVWRYLSEERGAGEWRERAVRQLRSPVLEAAIIQP